PGHRTENVAFDAAQGEQRNEGRDDDGRGEEDRPRYVSSRSEDGVVLHRHHGSRRNLGELALRKRFGVRQPTEDRLHHDHGGIDDQAEIDGADRQQVGGFAAQHQDADREEQRERYRGADNQRAAQVAEKYPLQQHDQQDSEGHVFEHRFRGGLDQVLAVIDPLDPHARRQNRRMVDLFDQLLDPGDRGRTLLAAAHQHDTLDDIVVLILARDSQSRLLAYRDIGNVLDQDRRTAARRNHGVGKRIDRPDQADAAHDRRLR